MRPAMRTPAVVSLILASSSALGAPEGQGQGQGPGFPSPIQTTTVPALVEVTPYVITAHNILPAIPARHVVRITDQATLDHIVAHTDPGTGAFSSAIYGTVRTGNGGYNRNSVIPKAYSWHLTNVFATTADLAAPCLAADAFGVERDIRASYNGPFCGINLSSVVIRPDTSLPADIDTNGKVGLNDYNLMRAGFTGPTRRCWQRSAVPGNDTACAADLNDDTRVDYRDGLVLRNNWGGLEINRPDVYEVLAVEKFPQLVPFPGALVDDVDLTIRITDPAGRVFGHGLPQLVGTASYEIDANSDGLVDDGVQFMTTTRGASQIHIERQSIATFGTFDLIVKINGTRTVLARDVSVQSLPADFSIFRLVPRSADIDGDGHVTPADMAAFGTQYTRNDADFDGDGRTTPEDLAAFMDAYLRE